MVSYSVFAIIQTFMPKYYITCKCLDFGLKPLWFWLLSQEQRHSTCFLACTQIWPATIPVKRRLKRSSFLMDTTITEALTGEMTETLLMLWLFRKIWYLRKFSSVTLYFRTDSFNLNIRCNLSVLKGCTFSQKVFGLIWCLDMKIIFIHTCLYILCLLCVGIWSTSLYHPTPVPTITLRRVPTTLTLRWPLRGLQLSSPKPRSSPFSSTQRTEHTLGTRSVAGSPISFTLSDKLLQPPHGFDFFLLVHLLSAPKSPWWPSGFKVLVPWGHHGGPQCSG